jgi:hypothetical protein
MGTVKVPVVEIVGFETVRKNQFNGKMIVRQMNGRILEN